MPLTSTGKTSGPVFRGYHRLAKTGMDRGGAAVLLLVAAPWFVLIAVGIWLEGSGPVFAREARIGQWGRQFHLLRFRRVARLGDLLGRWSLDELPQLINVLKGDMSFVGPRPRATHAGGQYGSDVRRLLLKPGLTGLWRSSGRSAALDDECVRLGWYLEHWSVGLDLAILWRSVRGALRRASAH
jgi:lipopolysaccharide/colanic/teichoic acid biosynthesis glycosyltransferase